MKEWLITAGVLIALAGSYWIGFTHAKSKGKAEIAALREDYAHKQQESEKLARAQEQLWAERLTEAIDERDKANADLASASGELRSALDRMRRTVSTSGRVPQAGSDTCKPCQAQLSTCKRLLLEGSELSSEGAEVFGRVATDKDALVRIVQ